jgi:hypothetical protein
VPKKVEIYEGIYLSKELELEELEAILIELKNEKSPSPNGLNSTRCGMWLAPSI